MDGHIKRQGASVQAKRAGYGQTYYDKYAGATYPEKLTAGYYRVRKSWSDAKSQLGAYRVLANAKKQADDNPGFYVFPMTALASIRSRKP